MMPQDLTRQRPYALIDKCPNDGRAYSRRERATMGCDEEYCCDWCKIEAEAPSGHPQGQRFPDAKAGEPHG